MNKKIKYFGIFLILLSILSIIFWLGNLISNPNSTGPLAVGLPIMVIAFVMFFFPGIYYFNVSKKQAEPNEMVKLATKLGIVIFILLAVLITLSILFIKDGAGFAVMGIMQLSLIFYILSIFVLIVGAIKRN